VKAKRKAWGGRLEGTTDRTGEQNAGEWIAHSGSAGFYGAVVTIGVYYKIGFRLEPQGRSGFAHLFEHMMFQGSANAPKMEHIKLINSSGGVLNGSTMYDVTNYYEAMPSNALDACFGSRRIACEREGG